MKLLRAVRMVANRATNSGLWQTSGMSIAATPMAFARSIVQAYCRHGQDPSAALRLAQITPEQLALPLGHITARQMEVLSGAAMQELDDESLGAYSRKLPWGSYEIGRAHV